MDTSRTYTLSLDPVSPLSRSSPLRSHPPPPSALQPGRAAGGVGEGRARARAAPAQTKPQRAERAPARSHPAPANTHPSPGLRLKRRPHRARRESTGELRDRAKPCRAAPPRSSSDPGARGSTQLGAARPDPHVTSRGGAGRARRPRRWRRRARPGGGARRNVGGGRGGGAGRELALAQTLALARAAGLRGEYGDRFWQNHCHLSFSSLEGNDAVPNLIEYSFCRH